MAGEDRSIVSLANPAVQSCWLCGTRLPAREMVADGGSACPDLRWYCADTRRCTERWTSRWSTGVGAAHGHAGQGHPGQRHTAQGLSGQGLSGQGLSDQERGQERSGVPGQGSGAVLGQGRGAIPDPRGRQLAGLADQ